jgi:Uma2 family endonuclease
MAVQIAQEQAVGVKRHLFSIDEYERMIAAGVFEEDARIELVRGEIVDMSPINPPHEACVRRLTKLLERIAGDRAIVSVQCSIRLPRGSQPQPDVAVLKWQDDFYASRRVLADDVLLLIEVAESSLDYDRGAKLAQYAEAGIPEYWVANIADRVVELYTQPKESTYTQAHRAGGGETLALPGGLKGDVKVDDILGTA